MKKIVAILACAMGLCTLANGQTLKFGHINSQEVISLMAERDSAIVKLQAQEKELVDEMEAMQVEFNNKYNTYNQKVSTWTAAVKETKEAELQEMSQRIQQFQQSAQQDLQQMQAQLMQPVIKKATDAIEKIAKANSLAYVFDIAAGAIIYKNDAQSMDLLPLVKKELNIPAEKVAPTQFPNN